MNQSIVITGVSTGIGYGAAKLFTQKGYRVFGSVRKAADGEKLKIELGENFIPLIFDVTDQTSVLAAAAKVESMLAGKGLAGLINNAGIATGGPLMLQELDEIRLQFEVNVMGLLGVTQAFLPLLGAQKDPGFPPGKILNISSVNGKISTPFLGAYSGSKFAVEGLSQALRRELLLYGIEVIIIGPGPVKTAIWEKAEDNDLTPVLGTAYEQPVKKFQKAFVKPAAKNGMDLEVFSEQLLSIFETSKPKTRYAILNNKFTNWILPRLLPERMIDKVLGKQLGLLPQK